MSRHRDRLLHRALVAGRGVIAAGSGAGGFFADGRQWRASPWAWRRAEAGLLSSMSEIFAGWRERLGAWVPGAVKTVRAAAGAAVHGGVAAGGGGKGTHRTGTASGTGGGTLAGGRIFGGGARAGHVEKLRKELEKSGLVGCSGGSSWRQFHWAMDQPLAAPPAPGLFRGSPWRCSKSISRMSARSCGSTSSSDSTLSSPFLTSVWASGSPMARFAARMPGGLRHLVFHDDQRRSRPSRC